MHIYVMLCVTQNWLCSAVLMSFTLNPTFMKLVVSPYTFFQHFSDVHFNYYPIMPTLNDIKMDLKSVG